MCYLSLELQKTVNSKKSELINKGQDDQTKIVLNFLI